jgi:chromosome segregation ATPase
VQLSESGPPAALKTSLEQIQARLADHYRAADAELAERREELESVRSQLAEEYRSLLRNKEAFEQWATRRQQEVEQRAQGLIAREQELHRQETVFNDLARQWQSEQLGLQQDIRRLKTRLGEPLTAAASG